MDITREVTKERVINEAPELPESLPMMDGIRVSRKDALQAVSDLTQAAKVEWRVAVHTQNPDLIGWPAQKQQDKLKATYEKYLILEAACCFISMAGSDYVTWEVKRTSDGIY